MKIPKELLWIWINYSLCCNVVDFLIILIYQIFKIILKNIFSKVHHKCILTNELQHLPLKGNFPIKLEYFNQINSNNRSNRNVLWYRGQTFKDCNKTKFPEDESDMTLNSYYMASAFSCKTATPKIESFKFKQNQSNVRLNRAIQNQLTISENASTSDLIRDSILDNATHHLDSTISNRTVTSEHLMNDNDFGPNHEILDNKTSEIYEPPIVEKNLFSPKITNSNKQLSVMLKTNKVTIVPYEISHRKLESVKLENVYELQNHLDSAIFISLTFQYNRFLSNLPECQPLKLKQFDRKRIQPNRSIVLSILCLSTPIQFIQYFSKSSSQMEFSEFIKAKFKRSKTKRMKYPETVEYCQVFQQPLIIKTQNLNSIDVNHINKNSRFSLSLSVTYNSPSNYHNSDKPSNDICQSIESVDSTIQDKSFKSVDSEQMSETVLFNKLLFLWFKQILKTEINLCVMGMLYPHQSSVNLNSSAITNIFQHEFYHNSTIENQFVKMTNSLTLLPIESRTHETLNNSQSHWLANPIDLVLPNDNSLINIEEITSIIIVPSITKHIYGMTEVTLNHSQLQHPFSDFLYYVE